jgi:hypothetical protein
VRPLDVAQGDGGAGGDVPDVRAALLAGSRGVAFAEREDAVGRRALVVDAFGAGEGADGTRTRDPPA